MDHTAINCSGGPGTVIGNVPLQHYDKDSASERRIEIAIGLDFIKRFPTETIVELGAVLPSHELVSHDVVDMCDKYEKSIRVDALEYDYTDKNVLSISTIEHIGRNDYADLGDKQTTDPRNAIRCVDKIAKQSNKYLITFPLGWNKEFQKDVENSDYKKIIMARDAGNNWIFRCSCKDFNFEYGRPIGSGEFSYGNAICIITNIEDYLYNYDEIERMLTQ